MSLHDVDKDGGSRSNPSLNVGDALAVRMAHATMGVTLVDEASGVSARVTFRDGKVEVYNSSDERLARVGVRESDTDGAVDVAHPGSAL